MALLSITLLGTPQISVDGRQLNIPTLRAMPLIAYLALNNQVHSRELVASLFWTDSSQKQALAALRTTVWRLKNAGLGDWFNLDRNKVGLNPKKNIEIDVINFKSLLDKCNSHGHPPSQICLFCTPILTEAVELYRGEFLAGVNISKALLFDNWRMQQSESLEALYHNALERLVRCHRTFGDFNLAIHYARRWLSCDHLNENPYIQLMQLYSITSQRAAGIALYKHYRELLSRELSIEPPEEMTALYNQIATGRSIPANKQKVKTPVFLIADIEKASVYWARAGDRKNEILSTYTNIIKDTARRFGGNVLQKSDDDITLLFENGQPLHCAVTIHLKLKNHDWGDLGPPSLRMVLYSTVMEGENPRNFAFLTRTASTLLSISWGGQIIFTDQTLRLLDLPAGSNIRDLGFHFLNETDGSVHVFELLHPHLPVVEHPPLQSTNQQLINFPILDPPFINREQELTELSQLLSSPKDRLISLVGPGGIGKTRLAVQVATRVTESFPDGIYFVPLNSIDDPEFIPILLADVLKFSYFGTTDHIDQLRRYLHRLKILLVIDNFEHLRLEGSKILAFLLAQTYNLKILVTSRERLNMIAETIYEVHGLPVPASPAVENADTYSSIRLFLQNAQRTFPKFSYQKNREAIIRICQLVDGIPLGVLLASSWVRVFTCSEIASEIKKNIDFLTTTAPDINPRHRSMSAVFNNSWKLLSEEERRILCRLSVFQTDFTTHAAQEICDATPLLLSVLVDKSLLSTRIDNRFAMLSTFQQYALARLDEVPDESQSTRAKFCEYYADFMVQKHAGLNTTRQKSVLEEINSEMENFRTAWSWMVEYDRWDLVDKCTETLLAHHAIQGNYSQGAEYFRLAFQKLDKLNSPDLKLIRASLQQVSAWMTFRTGFVSEGLQGLAECLEVFRAHNSTRDIAMTLFYMSEANRVLGKLDLAKEDILSAIKLMHSSDTPKTDYHEALSAHFQSVLGTILMNLGDLQPAEQNLLESLSVMRKIGTQFGAIHPLMGLGWLAYLKEEFLQARDLYLQALESAEQIHDQRDIVLIHNRLGAIYELIANPIESYRHVLSAVKFCQETGDHRLTAITLNNLAYQQLRYLHQPAESIWTYQKCLEIFSSIGDLRGLTYSSYDISKAYLKAGMLDEAWNYCLQSLNTARTLDSIPLILHTLHGFAIYFNHVQLAERALGLCCLIVAQPQILPDTLKRVIVSKSELEVNLSPVAIEESRRWALSTSLTDVISQLLAEKYSNHRSSRND